MGVFTLSSQGPRLGQTLCLLLCKLDYRRSEESYCAKKLTITFSLILQLHHQSGGLFGTPLSINILAIGHLGLPVRGGVNIAPAPHLAIDRFPWAISDCGQLHLPTGPCLGPPLPRRLAAMRVTWPCRSPGMPSCVLAVSNSCRPMLRPTSPTPHLQRRWCARSLAP